MESDERAANIGFWKLRTLVKLEIIRGPVRRKHGHGRFGLIAIAGLLATVAAVFRRKHQLLRSRIEIALRPAVPSAVFHDHHFLGWKLKALSSGVEFWPILVQLIATVLRSEQTARSVEVESFTISYAADIAFLSREDLTRFVSVVFPNTGTRFK